MFSSTRLFKKKRSHLAALPYLSVFYATLVLFLFTIINGGAVYAGVPSTYTVKSGDTLSEIALAHRISVTIAPVEQYSWAQNPYRPETSSITEFPDYLLCGQKR